LKGMATFRQVEKLISRLPELCDRDVVPTLLHGDAQQNNFISTENGAVVIDPAVHYGNPEMDLASVACYQPVPDDVFDGYRDELPIDPGFWERRNLWRVWGYLAAVAVEGQIHLGRLADAIQPYE
jgi:protein-ribulosamine 3-kinase